MKLSEIKQKIIKLLREDDKRDDIVDGRYRFRGSFHYKLVSIIVGFLLVYNLLLAFYPSILENPILTVPQSGELTLTNLFAIIVLGYVLIYSCGSMGSWMLDKLLLLGEDVKNRVKLSKFISDALVIIALVAVILYKIVFSTPSGVVR